jgi:hypothetical protein
MPRVEDGVRPLYFQCTEWMKGSGQFICCYGGLNALYVPVSLHVCLQELLTGNSFDWSLSEVLVLKGGIGSDVCGTSSLRQSYIPAAET